MHRVAVFIAGAGDELPIFLEFYGTRFEVNNQKVIEYLEKKNDFLSPFHLALINLISAAQKQNKN
jgi:hypothetical protein